MGHTLFRNTSRYLIKSETNWDIEMKSGGRSKNDKVMEWLVFPASTTGLGNSLREMCRGKPWFCRLR